MKGIQRKYEGDTKKYEGSLKKYKENIKNRSVKNQDRYFRDFYVILDFCICIRNLG